MAEPLSNSNKVLEIEKLHLGRRGIPGKLPYQLGNVQIEKL